jgi:hypothetical protein
MPQNQARMLHRRSWEPAQNLFKPRTIAIPGGNNQSSSDQSPAPSCKISGQSSFENIHHNNGMHTTENSSLRSGREGNKKKPMLHLEKVPPRTCCTPLALWTDV